ncbi:MAG: lactonase family protein [Verrucomicrobiota bacterium]
MSYLPLRPALLCAALLGLGAPLAADRFLVFVGTYTGPKSEGIHAYRFDADTGVIEELGLVARTPNPSFLALHPDGPYLYAANEIADFRSGRGGSVTAFRLDRANGRLTAINEASTVGGGPCHLVVDRAGRQVLVANYGGGSVCSLPIRPDGGLGEARSFVQHRGSSVDPARQKEPHAHSIQVSPDNAFAVAADLGTDRLHLYRLDPEKGLQPLPESAWPRLAPGSGPRHFAFHPDGRHAYVINEMLSTLTVFDYHPRTGRLTGRQTVPTLPAGFSGSSSTAEVVVHPGGRFVYGSNRGHDSLAVFAVEEGGGALRPVGHVPSGGRTPRNFNLDPTGRSLWVANQSTDNVAVFRVDLGTGLATPTGQDLKVGSPVCVKFLRVD